jgi:PIN domain nuclease of toxin-antitoxin system
MTTLLLDTCAAIWLVTGNMTLSQASRDALADTLSEGGIIAVSPITAWEIGLLNARGRLPLLMEPGAWFRTLIGLEGIELAALSADILIQSSFLPGKPPRDPADRIMAATARVLGYRLVTRDRLLLDYAEAGHVEALAC